MDQRVEIVVERLSGGEGDFLVHTSDGSLWLLRDGDLLGRWQPDPGSDRLRLDFLDALEVDPDVVQAWAVGEVRGQVGRQRVPLRGGPQPASARSLVDWDDEEDDAARPNPGDRLVHLADIVTDIVDQRQYVSLHGSSDPPEIPFLAAWLMLRLQSELGHPHELHSFAEARTLDELQEAMARGDPSADVFDGVWIGRGALAVVIGQLPELHRCVPDGGLEPDFPPEALAPVMAIRLNDLPAMLAVAVAVAGHPLNVGETTDDSLVLSLWSDREWRFESTSDLWAIDPIGPGAPPNREPMIRLLLPARPRARRSPTPDNSQGSHPSQTFPGFEFGGLPAHAATGYPPFDLGRAPSPPGPEQRAMESLRARMEEISPDRAAIEKMMGVVTSPASMESRVAELERLGGQRLPLSSPAVMAQLAEAAIETLQMLDRRQRR